MYKRTLFLLLTMAIPLHSRSASLCPTTTFLGSISFPSTTQKKPHVPAYYKGSQVPVDDGTYAIREDMCVQELFILCTLGTIIPQSKTTEDGNTIGNLMMPASDAYVCYRITHTQNPYNRFSSRKPLEWKIETVELKKVDSTLLVPDNTIIMLVNPAYIQGLENERWKSYNGTYRLPKIIFKESVAERDMNIMANQALMVSLDLNAFHRKPEAVQRVHHSKPSSVVSMAQR